MTLLVLTEEQIMLKDSAKEFLKEQGSVKELRRLRDERDATGFSPKLWQSMVELGFAGTLIPDDFGGSGFGHVGMGQIMEECGRNLTASPLFATAILGASALLLAGSEQQKRELLPQIAGGQLLLALAADEAVRHAPANVSVRAEKKGDGFVVNGRKTFVADGHIADKLIVSVRTSGERSDKRGLTLLLVDRTAKGVEVERTVMVDSRNSAIVKFNNVQVPAAAVLGKVDEGHAVLARILDIGNAHLAAELLGIAEESFDRTVQYLKERKQFGVYIGSFQALQHRAAHLWSAIELVKSSVLKALQALDANTADVPMLVSVAKAKACETAELATNEAVQMHGGIGMTDEFEIGFFMKRARPAQQLFGDYRYHANRFAELSGY
ncbi:MAG: acyl-CoA dehydrogenase family protein [Sulfurifustis sp.]